MKPIVVPTDGVQDWRKRLADPVKHWQTGYSAKTLAHAWEDAAGLPPEIAALLRCFGKVELLLAIPEYDVPLAGSERPSQNDVFALVRTKDGLIVIMVEGKSLSRLAPPSRNGVRTHPPARPSGSPTSELGRPTRAEYTGSVGWTCLKRRLGCAGSWRNNR